MIPYGRHDLDAQDIEAVVDVLRSDWLTQGPMVPRFEEAVASYCGARHAVAANSATSALHLACLALGLGPGDVLWTSPITFVASANCARYCGAEVDFVDIDPDTWALSIPALAEKLERAHCAGRLPKIVLPVHFAGQPCDMRAIRELADRYGFRVLEDAAHALGARDADAPVGACRHADITVFSFHPVKHITTGEGGMALTDDAALAARMRLLRSHGITREAHALQASSPGGWYYEQQTLGYNYRLTDIQAALGLSQLERLNAFLARRRELAACYDRLLEGLPLKRQAQRPGVSHAWHLYVIRLQDAARRQLVFEALRAAGIGAQVHYIPVHLQPYYRQLGFKPGDFPVAESYYAGAITLPLHPRLTEAEQERVSAVLKEALA